MPTFSDEESQNEDYSASLPAAYNSYTARDTDAKCEEQTIQWSPNLKPEYDDILRAEQQALGLGALEITLHLLDPPDDPFVRHHIERTGPKTYNLAINPARDRVQNAIHAQLETIRDYDPDVVLGRYKTKAERAIAAIINAVKSILQ